MSYFHEIQQIVCTGERIPLLPTNPLQTKTRKREIVFARQAVMYFLRLVHGRRMSWAKIGSFYSKDHATAMHARDAIQNLIDTDKNVSSKMCLYEIQIKAVINFEKNLIVDNLETTKARMKQMIDDDIPLTYELVTIYNALLEKALIPK